MATVHLARALGPCGFARLVAVKRMHPQLTQLSDFVCMFAEEARLTARVRHPNVVGVLELDWDRDGPSLVMDYVHGESLATLWRHGARGAHGLPPSIAVAIAIDVLHGLQAAHEARARDGSALGIVHRDVSPQNILVDESGLVRLIDFGVASAHGHLPAAPNAEVRGKLGYMAPEQLRGEPVTARADIFSLGVVLWESLSGVRLFGADRERFPATGALAAPLPDPVRARDDLPGELAATLRRALAPDPEGRFESARDMARALERSVIPATRSAVASWLAEEAGELLAARRRFVDAAERGGGAAPEPTSAPLSSRTSAVTVPI